MKNRKRPFILIPDDAGIIRAEQIPESERSKSVLTIGDLKKHLREDALYIEKIAKEFLETEPETTAAEYKDAMSFIIKIGEELRALIDDRELNTLPAHILEKVIDMGEYTLFMGRILQLSEVAPVLSKEQLLRETLACAIFNRKSISEGFAAATQDRAEKARAVGENLETLQETIEDRNRHRGERPRITQKQAAEYILRAEISANITNRSTKIDSIIRRVKTWDLYIKSNGEKGISPPMGYSRHNAPDAFALWARDVYVKDERYNKNNRDK